MKTTIASLFAVAIAVTGVSSEASARVKHRKVPVEALDATGVDSAALTVNRRSWLDPGPVAPRGTGANYVTANTAEFSKSQIDIQQPDNFGKDALPGQPYVPGRSQPVVEFSTTPNGRVDIANELLPQNFYYNPAPSRPPTAYRPSFSLEQP